ncbi:MAG TPA: hypothetical protein PLF61_00365 [Candidatus Goldiibacteriota bacterium]|nr:hypothetical protein [Candidatus Goldiibacteriota bacterium]
MLKKKKQRYIIICVFLCFFLFVLSGINYVLAQNQEQDVFFDIKPIYEFGFKAGRDPFEARIQKQQIPAIIDVDISTFKLIGITESQGIKTALFMCRSGTPFGFIFVDGTLYGENNKQIHGISGEIKSNDEVLLRQGDKEVLFKLTQDIEGPNIKPEESPAGIQ